MHGQKNIKHRKRLKSVPSRKPKITFTLDVTRSLPNLSLAEGMCGQASYFHKPCADFRNK